MDTLTPSVESTPRSDQLITENVPEVQPQRNSHCPEIDISSESSGGDLGEKENIQVQAASDCDLKTLPIFHSVFSDTPLDTYPDIPSTPHTDYIYHIKWITFQGDRRPVVTQNENGPCPIIAIANVLLLRGAVEISADSEIISGHRLVAVLSEFLLSQSVTFLDDGQLLNYETTVSDALNLFPSLQTGLDVNVRFTGVTSFEYTPALGVFDLFKIPIFHGWLVDPENAELVSVVGNLTYNQLVDRIIRLKASSDSGNITRGLIAEDFLHSTASQLTYHGLFILSSTVHDDQLAVFFRNNHFNTITKHDGRIYVLVTDMGFLNEPSVVWEVLDDVDGDTEFVDSSFQLYSPDTASAIALPSSTAPTADQFIVIDKIDLSTQNVTDCPLTYCPVQQLAEHGLSVVSDVDVALQLQMGELGTSDSRKHPDLTRCANPTMELPLAFSSSTSASHRAHHHPFFTVPTQRSSTGGERRDCRLL